MEIRSGHVIGLVQVLVDDHHRQYSAAHEFEFRCDRSEDQPVASGTKELSPRLLVRPVKHGELLSPADTSRLGVAVVNYVVDMALGFLSVLHSSWIDVPVFTGAAQSVPYYPSRPIRPLAYAFRVDLDPSRSLRYRP